MPILIEDLEHLKQLSKDRMLECYISLNGGLRSTKTIQFFPEYNTFNIINYIDDTEQDLTVEELFDEELTNIGKALTLKALYKY
jgi:uncharacterized protein YaaR (DUF327 family)